MEQKIMPTKRKTTKIGGRIYGYPVRKPNKTGWSLVDKADAHFGKHGEKNPPSKIQIQQDRIENRGTMTMVRKNLKEKKWELYRRKR